MRSAVSAAALECVIRIPAPAFALIWSCSSASVRVSVIEGEVEVRAGRSTPGPATQVARRLKVHERRVDRVAHIGTDQFLLILESIDGAKAAQQAAAIVDRLHGSFDYDDVSFQLDMRVGAAVFPADGAGAAELMQRADQLIVLVDSSKFRTSASFVVSSLDAIDIVVTDPGITADETAMLRDHGIEVVVSEAQA